MIAGTAKQTTAQMSDYLLCSTCEKRFNDSGESWVIANLPSATAFPIQTALKASPPMISGNELAAYAGTTISGVDVEKLIYFGISIFWRAAVHRWSNPNDGLELPGISLGKYEDNFRKFLLGESVFPECAATLVSVWPYENPPPPLAFHTPVSKNDGKFHTHQFYMAGLDFKLAVGNQLPQTLKRVCSYASPEKLIFASTKAATQTLDVYARSVLSSQAVGKLAENISKQKARK